MSKSFPLRQHGSECREIMWISPRGPFESRSKSKLKTAIWSVKLLRWVFLKVTFRRRTNQFLGIKSQSRGQVFLPQRPMFFVRTRERQNSIVFNQSAVQTCLLSPNLHHPDFLSGDHSGDTQSGAPHQRPSNRRVTWEHSLRWLNSMLLLLKTHFWPDKCCRSPETVVPLARHDEIERNGWQRRILLIRWRETRFEEHLESLQMIVSVLLHC